jgi:competence protein ComEA
MRAVYLLPLALAALCLAGDDGNASLLPEGPGKEVVAKVCTECHSVDRMRSLRIGKDDWWEKVADMVDRGAKATDPEVEAVVEYMSRNFGPDAKVWVNTAPMVELKAVLGFSVAEGNAVVAYRQSNGKFAEWRDLAKVPGLDAKKVEAKKDLMLF